MPTEVIFYPGEPYTEGTAKAGFPTVSGPGPQMWWDDSDSTWVEVATAADSTSGVQQRASVNTWTPSAARPTTPVLEVTLRYRGYAQNFTGSSTRAPYEAELSQGAGVVVSFSNPGGTGTYRHELVTGGRAWYDLPLSTRGLSPTQVAAVEDALWSGTTLSFYRYSFGEPIPYVYPLHIDEAHISILYGDGGTYSPPEVMYPREDGRATGSATQLYPHPPTRQESGDAYGATYW